MQPLVRLFFAATIAPGAILAPAAVPAAEPGPVIVAVSFDSVIHPISVEILRHAIEQAQRDGATAVLIRLDTPGGLLDATQQILGLMQSSPVPIVTLVTPSGGRAASAGFFLLLGGDVAAMVQGTRTGAASPILLGREMDQVLRKKVENDAAALIRGLSGRHGRNTAAAEQAVLEARAFTAEEALKEHLVDFVVASESDLWPLIDGREVTLSGGRKVVLHTAGARFVPYAPAWRERTVSALADPNFALPMLMLGALLLYFEFTSPGAIAPGVVGAILVLVALMALSALPVSAAGVALLLLAAVLFVLELKITSHGILGAGATVAMVLGSLLLIEGPPELRIRLSTALAVTLPFSAITLWLLSLVVRARRRPPAMGTDALLREPAVALTDLAPRGTVLVRGEYWTAESAQPVRCGQSVRILSVDGLSLRVEPVP